jgi:hypothetical protein
MVSGGGELELALLEHERVALRCLVGPCCEAPEWSGRAGRVSLRTQRCSLPPSVSLLSSSLSLMRGVPFVRPRRGGHALAAALGSGRAHAARRPPSASASAGSAPATALVLGALAVHEPQPRLVMPRAVSVPSHGDGAARETASAFSLVAWFKLCCTAAVTARYMASLHPWFSCIVPRPQNHQEDIFDDGVSVVEASCIQAPWSCSHVSLRKPR